MIHDIYLASPFFNPEQENFVDEVVGTLRKIGLTVFSPKEEGGIIGKTVSPDEAAKIFTENTRAIRGCQIMVAVIDDHDPGTIWEMGYAHASNIPTVTITQKGYGLNIMLSESSRAHYQNLPEFYAAMIRFHDQGIFPFKPWGGVKQ